MYEALDTLLRRKNQRLVCVDRLCTVEDAMLHEILGHTRYADGTTSTQWLCERHLHDGDDA